MRIWNNNVVSIQPKFQKFFQYLSSMKNICILIIFGCLIHLLFYNFKQYDHSDNYITQILNFTDILYISIHFYMKGKTDIDT